MLNYMYVRRRRTTFRRRFRRPYRRTIRRRGGFRRQFRRRGHLRSSRITVRPLVSTDTAFVKFRWNYVQEVSSTAGLAYDLRIRGNSIYDPQQEGVGTFAQGWSQWVEMYSRYQVVATKITVQYFSDQTVDDNSNEPMLVLIIPDNNPTPDVDFQTYSSTDLQYMLGTRARIATTAQAKQNVHLTHYMTLQKMFGLKLDQLDDTISEFSNNPSKQWYWHVMVKPLTSGSVARGWVNVKVTYYTKLSDKVREIYPGVIS